MATDLAVQLTMLGSSVFVQFSARKEAKSSTRWRLLACWVRFCKLALNSLTAFPTASIHSTESTSTGLRVRPSIAGFVRSSTYRLHRMAYAWPSL